MPDSWTIAIVSDIHYASPAEQARRGYEERAIHRLWLRMAVKAYRRYIWLRDPLAHNHLLDRFLDAAGTPDEVVANGDYSCDSGFVGVSDDAAFASAKTCLDKLRQRFPGRVNAVFGDHELGKMSLFGGQGGLRLASWHRAVSELNLPSFWRRTLGRFELMGVVSSLLALPVFDPEILPDEAVAWQTIRARHMAEIGEAFAGLPADRRIILFCHDPTALPFLLELEPVRQKLSQIELTMIGHLHTGLIFRLSRMLTGLPTLRFLGNSARRMSTALNQARCWRQFNVRLCPSLAGSELLKDGGYCTITLPADPEAGAGLRFHPLPR